MIKNNDKKGMSILSVMGIYEMYSSKMLLELVLLGTQFSESKKKIQVC